MRFNIGWVVVQVVVFFVVAQQVSADSYQSKVSQLRPVHTYSIVARDEKTGELGVAVQSHWFSVGSLVPWAKAGVGAVATQSFLDVRYGASGLELMQDGWDAKRTLTALMTADPHPEIRQVAMIDVNGGVAAFTGDNCIQYAGHRTGKNFSVQANLMINDGVTEAMERAFLESDGPLARRMLNALLAAQAVGGDARGKQSAALLVVKGKSSGKPWEDRLVDLHVEDNKAPLKELSRLYKLHLAYNHMNKGDLAIENGNVEDALSEYGAAEELFPDNLEMKFWHAVSLVNDGRVDESLPIFANLFSKEKNWRTLVPRLSEVKLLPQDKETISKILSVDAQ